MCLRGASMPRRCRRTPDGVLVCSTPVAQQQLLSTLLSLLLLLVHGAGAAPGTIKVGTCQEGYAPMVISHEDGTFTGLEIDQVRVLVFPFELSLSAQFHASETNCGFLLWRIVFVIIWL